MSRALMGSRMAMMPAARVKEKASVGEKAAPEARSVFTEKTPAMRQFLGVPDSSRAEVIKKIWQYVKENKLQNPADKQEIRCDKMLKSIFEGRYTVGFFEVTRFMSHHFVKVS